MKTVLIEFYECETCKALFKTKKDCELHEKYTHKCPQCEHCFYLYGIEQNCDRGDAKCSFKQKKK